MWRSLNGAQPTSASHLEKAALKSENASLGLQLSRGDEEDGIDDIEEDEEISVGREEEREGNSRKRERKSRATAKAIIGARKLMGFDGTIRQTNKVREMKEFTCSRKRLDRGWKG